MKNVLKDCAPATNDIRRLAAQVGAVARNLTDNSSAKGNRRTFAAVASLGLAAAAITVPASGPLEIDPETGVIRADTGQPVASEFDLPEATTLAVAAEEAASSLAEAEQFSAYNVSPDRLYEIRKAQWVVEELQARAAQGSIEPSSEDLKPAVLDATDELLNEVAAQVADQVPADEMTEAMLVEALATASATLDSHVEEMSAILAQRPERPDTSVAGSPSEVLFQLAADAQADADRIAEFRDAVADYGNGEIPREYMCQLSTFEWHVLRCDAAIQFERLNAAFRAEFGYDLEVTDSFRSLEQQIEAKEAKPKLAAKPGTSNHGWGQALDFAGELHQGYDNAEYLWMYENAPLFGWHNPDWARPGGQKAEPWHWEFNGRYAEFDYGYWDGGHGHWGGGHWGDDYWPDGSAPEVVDPQPITPELPPVDGAVVPETPIGVIPTIQPRGAQLAPEEATTVVPEVRVPQLGDAPAPIRAVVPDGNEPFPFN